MKIAWKILNTMTDETHNPESIVSLTKIWEAGNNGLAKEYPERLNLGDIQEHPDLFQPRGKHGEDEKHISILCKALGSGGNDCKVRLDPVVVIPIGNKNYLIDGYHRVAAYRHMKVETDIPVEFFKGSPKDAILESGIRNNKDKLPMTNQQKQDFAWKLVVMGVYSKAQEESASGVSNGQIAVMRKAKKALGDDAQEYETWWKARSACQGMAAKEDFDRDEWLESQARGIADKLAKTFGKRLSDNTELTAKVFDIYFGRKLAAIHHDMKYYLPELDDEHYDGEAEF